MLSLRLQTDSQRRALDAAIEAHVDTVAGRLARAARHRLQRVAPVDEEPVHGARSIWDEYCHDAHVGFRWETTSEAVRRRSDEAIRLAIAALPDTERALLIAAAAHAPAHDVHEPVEAFAEVVEAALRRLALARDMARFAEPEGW